MYILICFISPENSFGQNFVPINVCSEKLCFWLKSSFLEILKEVHCIFKFLLLGSIIFVFEKLGNCRFGCVRT